MHPFKVTPGPGWHAPYIGVPYKWGGRSPDGWDCWGLYRFCIERHFGLDDLPLLGEVTTDVTGASKASRFAAQEAAITRYREVWKRLERPILGAAVLFNIGGRPLHLGLYLRHGEFLHCVTGAQTAVERLEAAEWRNRVEGFYVPC